MVATVPYIKERFAEFNRQCFGGVLPPVPIELSNAKTFIGQCVYRKRRSLLGKTEFYDFRLRINTRIDLSKDELDDTILHEMIHYYIAFKNLRDTSAHGTVFRGIMNDLNMRFGRSMTVSHRSSRKQREQAYDTRERYHVIAVVSFSDGRTGFKVLPRVLPRIVNYYNKVGTAKGVAGVELYMSKDIFFNRYPNSGALNVHYIERGELMGHLTTAERMACNGIDVLRNQ